MAAAELDGWFRSEAADIADSTVSVRVNIVEQAFLVLFVLGAVLMQARKALLLVFEATASVPTGLLLIARHFNQLLALLRLANIFPLRVILAPFYF